MKKLLTVLALIGSITFNGCDKIPDAETVRAFSKCVGTTAAMACNFAKLDKDVIDHTVAILGEIKSLVPTEDQKVADLWKPEIEKLVDKLVEEGKLDKSKATLVTKVLETAAKGIDLLFDRKPNWKKYPDVVANALDGFYDGFVGSLNENLLRSVEIDKEIYEQLKW